MKEKSPFTLREMDDIASPAWLIALHIYTPESSTTVEVISRVTKPKSWVSWNRDPKTKEISV